MIEKILVILLFLCYYVFAETNFIEQGKRAEFFELSDKEVGVVRVTIPDNELDQLLDIVDPIRNTDVAKEIENFISSYKPYYRGILEGMKSTNFKEAFEDDLASIVKILKIDSDGYSHIDVDEIMDGTDFEASHYVEGFVNIDYVKSLIFYSNRNFNMDSVLYSISASKIKDRSKIGNVLLDAIEKFREEYNMKIERKRKREYIPADDFKTKNATMVVELNGEKKSFDQVTFSLGGKTAIYISKPGYNIKINDEQSLFGRKQFRLRSEINDPSMIRSKIVSDIHNRLGMKSTSAAFVELYLNRKYMGLFSITDIYKKSWVEYVYGEKDTLSLYKCDSFSTLTYESSINNCENENENVLTKEELESFLKTLDSAETETSLENVFDIDHFLKEVALEYLTGSTNHLIYSASHNYYLYKPEDDKWMYLAYDFGTDLGVGLDTSEENNQYLEFTQYPFEKFAQPHHIIKVLILNNSERFNNTLKEIVTKAFNPTVLFPRIDEIKEFIKPYIIKDKTPINGYRPGVFSKNKAGADFSVEEWNQNVEFKSVKTTYGVKRWILEKYRYVCKEYNIECDAKYLDPNYPEPVKTNDETEKEKEGNDISKSKSEVKDPGLKKDESSKSNSVVFGSFSSIITINVVMLFLFNLIMG